MAPGEFGGTPRVVGQAPGEFGGCLDSSLTLAIHLEGWQEITMLNVSCAALCRLRAVSPHVPWASAATTARESLALPAAAPWARECRAAS